MSDGSAHLHQTLTSIFRLVVVTPILISSIHLFLYAIYICLFRRVLSILKARDPSADLRFHQITLILLFVLASVSVPICLVDDIMSMADSLWTYEGVEFSERIRDVIDGLDICRYCIFLAMAIAGDSIMVFRCYVLWGYKKRYVVGPLVGLILVDLTAIVTGVLSINGSRTLKLVGNGCLAANGVLNFILASMIAGRLFWVLRTRRDWLEEATARRFKNIVSIILGSGFLLVVAMAVDVVGNLLPDESYFDLGSVLIQMAGIAPTLIVVRANTYRDGSEAGVDSCGLDETAAGDLESRSDTVDLQTRPGS
ncbi:hypothetical protein PM082_009844 [Marasmius tenuissimus]|nr:hypothetical protein PM082_009844 [Marasmius tenuissimus]